MADAIVSFAVERLRDLLIQEARFLYEVTDKVEEILAELIRMKCFLKDADARQDEDEIIRNWVAEIREAAYDAEDVLQTFAFEVALRRRSGFQNTLKRWACILFKCKALHKIGTEIDTIKSRISNLTTSLQSYNIRSIAEGGRSDSRYERQRLLRRAYSHVVDEDPVGVEENVKLVVKQLVTPDKRCSVVSIWGMGGLGKTTLAKKVYHHGGVRGHFESFTWTHLSQQFNLRGVVQSILIKLTSASGEKRNEIEKLSDDELFEKVHETQEQKKCLVILDDLWRIEDWEKLRPAFSLQKGDSKILLTTRNQAVALHVHPQGFLYQMKCLTVEESWKLLRGKAFSKNDHDPSIREMEELGKKMVQHCNGLPLAVVVLGGLLAAKPTFHEWEIVHRNIKSYLRRGNGDHEQYGSGVLDVLALSYQDLPYYLKPCFLYLAHFPEDYKISTNALVRMWMAEGIISRMPFKGGGEETLEDIGKGYLDELINRCMVQPGARNSSGRVKTCHLHSLMRHFCLSKVNEENFLDIINAQQGESISSSMVLTTTSNKVRRRAIYLDEGINILSSKQITENARHLRSLLVFCDTSNGVQSMMKKLELKDFKLLRVLNLERLSLEEKLLKAISNLIHLKFLSFKKSMLQCFPSSMGNLKSIQTLDLRFTIIDGLISCLKIHNVICRMKSLSHLYLPKCITSAKDGSTVNWPCLSNLEMLKNFDAERWTLNDLAQLTKLRKLQMFNVRSIKDLEVILKPSCPISDSLHSLILKDVSIKMEENDLMLFSTCQHLYKVYLSGQIGKLPEHYHFPPSLFKLTLESSKLEEDPIPILERLLKLTILCLEFDSYIGSEMVFSKNGFPRLKNLTLSWISSLTKVMVYEGAMPGLKSLKIESCKSLDMVPEGLRYVTTLQVLKFQSMPREFNERLQVINGNEGEDFYKVKHAHTISISP